ncbi:prenyltransferase/squalene oxidase repeat-containing protein [Desulfatibacillum aliphaticivorans]|uniref:prenyltransferase/squalene oxidase repeat-containing protein n=1 Tax=Desulfatibacillum aliphaticivorans TaxID=218208 RepID=UPI00040F3B3E|nr:prenyltransferase/squalene oxidase repeat-containing protein [Desulfatibacillum aliphaticivorans]
MKKRLAMYGIVFLACFFLSSPAGFGAVISSTELIEGGQAYLLSQQAGDGSWTDDYQGEPTTSTALALAALIDTGVSKDHEAIKKGVDYLLTRFNGEYFDASSSSHFTYCNGAVVMALSMYAADNPVTRTVVMSATQSLLNTQYINPSSNGHGGWYYYNYPSSNGDLSNTQFAAMGLYYAEQYLGAIQDAAEESWKDALYTYLTKDYNSTTGASGYRPGSTSYIPAMTGASLWCMSLIGHETDPIAVGSVVSGSETPGNVGWFENNYDWEDPYGAPQYYYLYAWAKALTAAIGTENKVGEHDWVDDMVTVLASLAIPVARKDETPIYYWDSNDSLDGGNIIATSWAMMSMAFADINVESPEKRVSDVPEAEGEIDYPIRGLLTLKTEGGVTITGAKRRLADLFRWKGKSRLKLPVGAVEFVLHHVPVGGQAKLTIKLPRDAVRNDVADSFVDENGDPKPYLNWFKIQNGEWKGVTPIEVDPVAETITVWLTDGGPEDADGVANGEIVDPGAPGITDGPLVEEAAAEAAEVEFGTESSDSICFVKALK